MLACIPIFSLAIAQHQSIHQQLDLLLTLYVPQGMNGAAETQTNPLRRSGNGTDSGYLPGYSPIMEGGNNRPSGEFYLDIISH